MEQILGFEINVEDLWEWVSKIFPILQVVLIIIAAYLLRRLSLRVLTRLQERYHVSAQIVAVTYRFLSAMIAISAFFFVLDCLGVSGRAIWTAFTGFAAVAAVAFFAAWSVLSNIFCALLIITVRPFRLYDYVELLENGDKPGLKGQVIDINFIFSTLRERNEDGAETILQIPNSLFFQRLIRRWQGNSTPYSHKKKAPPPAGDIVLDFTPETILPKKSAQKEAPKTQKIK
ncbi:MAG: mechanosensitive ion channel domain-containing protein [Saezia sp.]